VEALEPHRAAPLLLHWDEGTDALVFGFGSFYNHSATPNAEFIRRPKELIMEYVARQEIAAGEEIFIKYGCPLWF